MNLLGGNCILSSIARCVFIMTRASDADHDDRLLLFNPKNNNGALAAPSAWRRTPAGFDPVPDFDWDAFDEPPQSGRKMVTLDHLRRLFENAEALPLSEAVERLALIADISKSAAYTVLNQNGRFAKYLSRQHNLLTFSQ